MTTSTKTNAWPEGVIARYLTVGGSTIDVIERSSFYGRTDPTETVATCAGCGDRSETFTWTQQIWSYTSDCFVEETDEGGHRSAQKARTWAQSHAEKCRAMPRP
jgi:hypothetical protein